MGEHHDARPGLPTSPSGRVPQWVLDEAAGRTPVGVTGRDWTVEQAPARPVRRGRGRWVAVLLLLAVVAAVVLQQRPTINVPAAAAPAPPDVVASTGAFPSPRGDSAGAPLGTPPPAPAGDGDFAFTATQDDGATPIAYDPCRPVDVVVNLDGAPRGAESMVGDALARMIEVTGLQFRYEGITDEVPSERRPSFQPDRYGDRWAPVLIAWRTPEQVPALAGGVAGLGGSAWAGQPGGTKVYVSGSVTLDGPESAQLVATDRGAAVARSILLHELAHVVGLQHVADDTQLMYESTNGEVLDFADGDLTGLARLGGGPCVPQL